MAENSVTEPRHSPSGSVGTAVWMACPAMVVLGLGLMSAGAGGAQARDDDTHGRNAIPDYARVFAQDVVKRLDIWASPADWPTS